jgi:hypothetical protein
MKTKHGFNFVSRIPVERIETLCNKIKKYLVSGPKRKDRAKNVIYKVPEMGKIIISKTRGTVTIYTDNETFMYGFFKKILCKNAFKIFKENINCKHLGLHSGKLFWSGNAVLHVYKQSDIVIRLYTSICSHYTDFHIQLRVPLGVASFDTNATPDPNHKLCDFIRKFFPESNSHEIATLITPIKNLEKSDEDEQ